LLQALAFGIAGLVAMLFIEVTLFMIRSDKQDSWHAVEAREAKKGQ
jgi:hypothetical protein